MKKITVILLTIFYLLVSTGFSLTFHYCFGRLKSVSVNAPVKGCCPKKGFGSCCKSTTVKISLPERPDKLISTQSITQIWVSLPTQTFPKLNMGKDALYLAYPYQEVSPIPIPKPLFLLFRSFKV